MKKKLLLRLCLIITVALSLESCTPDNLILQQNSSSEILTSSKSLWEEDEKYITKVKSVYTKNANENYILQTYGMISWEYAMTMDQFDESYLIVPVLRNNKVVNILEVFREKNKVYFQFSRDDKESNTFFQTMIFDRDKIKAVPSSTDRDALAKGGTIRVPVCKKYTFIVYPIEGAGGNQSPIESTKTICKFVDMALPASQCLGPADPITGECMGGGTGTGEGGYEYPEPPEEDPCKKTKAISTDPAVTAKVGTLKEQSKIEDGEPNYGEKAFEVKNDGTTSDIIIGEKHKVKLGSEAGKQGAYHNHTPDGIKMLSPPDILKMLNYALAQPNGNLSNGFLGMVGSEKCGTCPDGYKYHNYIIRFSGNSQELEKFIFQTNWDEDALEIDYNNKVREIKKNPLYINQDKKLNNTGLQKLFFDTLKNMKMEEKVTLQKIEDNGLVQNIILDNASNPSTIQCP